MSNPEDSEDQSKKRRGRTDNQQRNYGCPCGKNYLSYPALFTHVKTKHNGKAPGQLIKPKSENVKRGRPRTNQQAATNNSINGQSVMDKSTGSTFAQKANNIFAGHTVPDPIPEFNIMLDAENNCNRIFAEYYRLMNGLQEERQQIIGGFLWLLKRSLEDRYGQNFCREKDASEIIEVSNILVDQKRQEYLQNFGIGRDLMIMLTKLFFDWLYSKGYTDHYIKETK